MLRSIVIGGLLVAGGALAAPSGAPRRDLDLAGDWHYLPYDGPGDLCSPAIDDAGWATMHLPSNWFLLGSKEYPARALADQPRSGPGDAAALAAPDPAEGLDYAGTVWFRRRVDWQPGSGRQWALDLDMVDYYAEVQVNGTTVGRHEGYFQRFSLDVTRALRPGANLVCVRVSAPALIVDMAQQYAISWPKQQNQIKGIFGYHDTRPGGTSRRGQSRGTGGILRGVGLREVAGLSLESVTVTPLEVSEARARLVLEATVHNWTAAPIEAALDGEIAPKNFKGGVTRTPRVTLRVAPGEQRVKSELVLDHPALWWTWDRGRPNLYQLRARISDNGANGRLPDGRSESFLDERSETFGVRSITHDEKWVFRLNGQRLYLRGSNYIATQWLSQADRAFYERDVKLMVAANLNTIRVHAHLERPEFYDAADEAGVLVWQDFPLQWSYTDLPAFREEALRQTADMITRFGNHPSIGVWSMHNESPHAMSWMKRRVPDQNLALDNALVERAAALDPSRIAHRDSGTGDGHYYFGWYHDSVGAMRPLPRWIAPLVTEYGAQALPDRRSLERTIEPRALWPRDRNDDDAWEAWQYADFQPRWTFELARIDRGRNLDEFVAHSQAYQAALIRFQTELLRRVKWTRSTGVYHFMFVDDWPSITWSVLDYFRQPKSGYAALAGSMQRVLPSIDYQIDDPAVPLSIHVINDDPRPYPGARVRFDFLDGGGKRMGGGEQRIDLAPDSVAAPIVLGPHPELAAGRARLEVRVDDSHGRTLGRSSLGAADYVPPPPPQPAK